VVGCGPGGRAYARGRVYWILKAVLTPIVLLLVRVRVEGREHLPRRGPVILAANHRSFLDSIFIPLVVHRRVTFVAKAEYFDDPKTAWFFRGVGQIPIRRDGGSASERALASATDVLRAGRVFAIYPEGTRTRDGRLHRGHTGVARLAVHNDVAIVPVGLVGTDEVQPVDARLPRLFRRVTIRIGAPVAPERYAGAAGAGSTGAGSERARLREYTDEVMFEIGELCGYEYVDTYATRQAEGIPSEEAKVAAFGDARPPGSVAS